MVSILPSCNFLDEIPPSNLVGEQVFKSMEASESALEGCYQSLIGLYSSHFLNFVQGASVLQHIQTSPEDSWFNHTLYSNHPSNAKVYMNVYAAIAKCNSFIDCAAASELPEDFIVEATAQVRFLRAYIYFFATRIWGDLPLVLDKVVTINQAEVGRTSYQSIYKTILDDLNYAEGNLKTRAQQSAEEIKRGHVCKYAATALKAKVYVQIASLMTSAAEGRDDQWFDLKKEGRYPDFSECGIPKDNLEKAWGLALESAEKVILEGPFDLEEDYSNLFRFDPQSHPEDYLSKERILTIPITSSLTGGSYAYASWSLPKQPYGSAETATDNGNKLRVRPSRFIWQTWCEKYGTDSDYVEAVDDELGSYSYYSGCPDPRMDATYFGSTYYTGVEATGEKSTVRCYPDRPRVAFTATTDIATTNTIASLNCVPIYKKGFSKGYRGSNTGGDADIYLFRYADVILLAAEAAANLGNTGKAVGYVNQILDRARNSTNKNSTYSHNYGDAQQANAPKAWEVSEYSDKDELILAILWERIFEMDYECHSLFDIKRYGATYYVENFVKPFNAFMHTPANYRLWKISPMFNYGRDRQEDIEFVRAGLLIAYPEYELLNNPALNYATGQNDFFIE